MTIQSLDPRDLLYARDRYRVSTPYGCAGPWATWNYVHQDPSPQARAASDAALWDRGASSAGHEYRVGRFPGMS